MALGAEVVNLIGLYLLNDPLQWDGQGLQEVGRRSDNGAVVVRIDPRYFRPAEVETLLGDPTRAREKLGWTPSTSLEEMVSEICLLYTSPSPRDS